MTSVRAVLRRLRQRQRHAAVLERAGRVHPLELEPQVDAQHGAEPVARGRAASSPRRGEITGVASRPAAGRDSARSGRSGVRRRDSIAANGTERYAPAPHDPARSPHRPARLRHRRLRRRPPAARPRRRHRAGRRQPGRGARARWCATPPRACAARARGLLTADFAAVRDDPDDPRRRRGHGRRRADPRLPARAVRGRQVRRLGEQAAARAPRRGAVRGGRAPRRAAALRGVGLRRDPGRQGAARIDDRERRRGRPGHRQRHDELHPHRHGRRPGLRHRRWRARRSWATPRPTPPRT